MYAEYTIISTTDDSIFEKNNLVTLTRHEVIDAQQIKHDCIPQPQYLPVTSIPESKNSKSITCKPILYTRLYIENEEYHILNIDLQSNKAKNIPGQLSNGTWETNAGLKVL